MEMPPEEEAQTVMLEEMEGAQYIAIHRQDGAPLTKNIPIFTLNGEMIPEKLVVDMMNSDVGSEYSTSAQYYEAEDLLPEDMTEEDRKLAAALVAVQIQQQKQQMEENSAPELQNVVELQTLEPVIYSVDSMQEGNSINVEYPDLSNYEEEDELTFKYEEDNKEKREDEVVSPPAPKRSLPHKKRIPRKLKQQGKKNHLKKDTKIENPLEMVDEILMPAFKCELCGSAVMNQLKFFEHLKTHYEPLKSDQSTSQFENGNNLDIVQTVQVESNPLEEFSESEDLMEGIRSVVEETGARIDDESDNPLSEANNSGWSNTSKIGNINNQTRKESSEEDSSSSEKSINLNRLNKKGKKKSRKIREEHTCKHCNRYFNHKNSLNYHMRSHSGERPHQCEICGKSFFAASALKVHKRLHSGDKPYKCEDCGRHFRQWGDLKYHSTSLHSELRQFQCEYCGKDFARKYSLVVHQRIHTGEKNYRCEFCNKTFRASSYLQNHRRIHTGEKPHPCTVCGKPFRVRSDMKRHMLTHSRNKSERIPNKAGAVKPKTENDEKSLVIRSQTIGELVQQLKLEVEPGSVGRYEPVPLVAPEENHETILPHENANIEFNPTENVENVTELDTNIRSSDNFHYLFM